MRERKRSVERKRKRLFKDQVVKESKVKVHTEFESVERERERERV